MLPNKPWHGDRWPKGVPYEVKGYEKPLFSILEDSAREFPRSTYTIFQGAGRTFSEVKETADRIAFFLYTSGIKKGDRGAIFLPNIPHYPEIFFGILKAGGVCVTCNPLYKAAELNYQLKDAQVKAAFVMDHEQFYQTALEALEDTDIETVVICNIKSYLPAIKGLLGGLLGKIPKAERHDPGHITYDEMVRFSSPKPVEIDLDPLRDPAVIVYTGGTTGVPKGACLTHANLMSNVITMYEWIRLQEIPGGPLEKAKKGGLILI